MTAPDLVAVIRQADARETLFMPSETVVVGVSGGVDSVALLDALYSYAPERDLRLHVAHLDHALRPSSADDAAFVARLADGMGLPASLAARDVAALAAGSGRSLEEAARAARYAFLATVAAHAGARSVVVGHHADDQAETVLMNFLRGSGLAGLKGMTPVAGYPLSAGQIVELAGRGAGESVPVGPTAAWPPRLLRPLLASSRQDIEAYAHARRLTARLDLSNRDPLFLRNRLRHEIMPLLTSVNPRLRETLIRNSTAIAEDLALLETLTDEAWARCVTTTQERDRFDLAAWHVTAPALQLRLLRRAAERLTLGREFGWEHIEAVRRAVAENETPAGLPGGVKLWRSPGYFELARAPLAVPPPRLTEVPQPLLVPGEMRLPGGWRVVCQLRERRPDERFKPRSTWMAWLDADVVGEGLAVRGRRPGDRYQPLGMAGRHKSVQDLFVDHRVPRSERDGWPLVVAGDEIVWVPGLQLAELARIRAETRRLVGLEMDPPERLRG